MRLGADGLPDDRVCCAQCAHLERFTCNKYRRREIPVLKRRCEGFNPNKDQPDRRTAAERWPNLRRNIEEARTLDREHST